MDFPSDCYSSLRLQSPSQHFNKINNESLMASTNISFPLLLNFVLDLAAGRDAVGQPCPRVPGRELAPSARVLGLRVARR